MQNWRPRKSVGEPRQMDQVGLREPAPVARAAEDRGTMRQRSPPGKPFTEQRASGRLEARTRMRAQALTKVLESRAKLVCRRGVRRLTCPAAGLARPAAHARRGARRA